MSAMKCTICPQPKKIGFLIVIEGELCSGIPEKFSADSSLNGLLPAGGKIWLVKEADGSGLADSVEKYGEGREKGNISSTATGGKRLVQGGFFLGGYQLRSGGSAAFQRSS